MTAHGTTESGRAFDRLENLVADYGAQARPLRRVVALLTERPWTIGDLVRASGVARRTVEEVLACLTGDLEGQRARDDRQIARPEAAVPGAPEGQRARDDRQIARPEAAVPGVLREDPATSSGTATSSGAAGAVMISPQLVAAYRDRFGFDELGRTALSDPLAARLTAHRALVDTMDDLVAAAPPSRIDLDHVPATGETAARRALWMDSTYDLTRAHLLCIGDHDLTSLAACILVPGLSVTVVDLDERLLEFIDAQSRDRGLDIRCLFADLRFGLPAVTESWADLIFTDPPYTPEGVTLFLHRGLAGLRDTRRGRLLLAYGHSDLHPALGWKVQRAVSDLHLTVEAIMADFNGYDGAEAVGATSDLYVCRPTATTWRQLAGATPGSRGRAAIYTRGRHAVESAADAGPSPAAAQELLATAAVGLDGGRLVFLGDGAPDTSPAGPAHVRLATALRGGLPKSLSGRRRVQVAADLSADPGPWLARTLLAVNADRLVALIPVDHADLVNPECFHALGALFAPKWRLCWRRLPHDRLALLEAAPIEAAPLSTGEGIVRWLFDRPHGKVGNVWTEALTRDPTTQNPTTQNPTTQDPTTRDPTRGAGCTLSKKDARAAVEAAVADPGLLAATLMDLPRHQITRIARIAAQVGRPSAAARTPAGG
ncbi:bis-aminopropyl spermidine synthase family protein [Frankia sp. Cr1]|uniref:bis-aminopropyl spermidine synthase family protein n=1 Tax=Frankia sp. Cr1 TaxID=3073931 RepID=UPI002AD383D1|nr:bis-aminopropyl spermidine synthase family protein [Frankia sp. Cr1]